MQGIALLLPWQQSKGEVRGLDRETRVSQKGKRGCRMDYIVILKCGNLVTYRYKVIHMTLVNIASSLKFLLFGLLKP